MGQGIYTAFVFGAIDPPIETIDDAGYHETAEWFDRLASRLRHDEKNAVLTGYETDKKFAGVVIACSDPCLVDDWHCVEFSRRVIVNLDDWIAENCADKLVSARAAWEQIREAGRDNGVEIPEGGLLIVSDWD